MTRNIQLIATIYTPAQVAASRKALEAFVDADPALLCAYDIVHKVENYLIEINSVQLTLGMDIDNTPRGQKVLF